MVNGVTISLVHGLHILLSSARGLNENGNATRENKHLLTIKTCDVVEPLIEDIREWICDAKAAVDQKSEHKRNEDMDA